MWIPTFTVCWDRFPLISTFALCSGKGEWNGSNSGRPGSDLASARCLIGFFFTTGGDGVGGAAFPSTASDGTFCLPCSRCFLGWLLLCWFAELSVRLLILFEISSRAFCLGGILTELDNNYLQARLVLNSLRLGRFFWLFLNNVIPGDAADDLDPAHP